MRRSIPLVAVALGAALTLSACGGDAQEPAETGEPTAEETGATEELSDGGSLTIWVDETRQAAVEAAAEQFEAETGATVETVLKDFGDIRTDFIAQVPTGEGPDITVGAHDWLGELLANGVVGSVDLGDAAGDFEEVAVAAFSQDGQLYGLPYTVENIALIRNTDLTDVVPSTWDEMLEASEAAGTTYPVVMPIGEEGDPYHMYPLQTSFGAPVFEQNEDGSYTAELALGGEAGNAFAQWLAEQGDAGNLDTAIDYSLALEAFRNGESPYLIGGPWTLGDLEGMNLEVHAIPSAGGEPAQPFAGVQGFYVSAQSDNALLANDFLVNFMATEEAQLAIYEAGNRPPAYIPAAEAAAENPLTAGFAEVGADAVPMPSIPEMGSVWAFWGVTEAQIISGAQEPVAAWEKMVSDIQGALDAS
ncbi:MAG: extracellular solute-binding protein [Actinotalea sp.]|nr:extracellular solute-binding protein [Actinotalea sp.]